MSDGTRRQGGEQQASGQKLKGRLGFLFRQGGRRTTGCEQGLTGGPVAKGGPPREGHLRLIVATTKSFHFLVSCAIVLEHG